MRELRILSGLHRGAALPLGDESLVVGADESADVVLLDPGIEPEHASLRDTGAGWALSSLNGAVFGNDTNKPLTSIDFLPGECGRIGAVWVTVVDESADWQDPPPEPVDIETGDLQSDTAQEPEDGGTENHADAHAHADADDTPEQEPAPAEPEAAAPPADGEQVAGAPETAGVRTWSRAQVILGALALVTVVAAVGGYQISGRGSGSMPYKRGVKPDTGTPVQPAKDPALSADTDNDNLVTPEELRTAFRKRLAEVDLLKRFDLKLRDNSWTMQAVLDDEEAARFERVMAAFVSQHRITFPINARIGNAEHMLPFKITQVISGANASVVTADGNRLYIGDEYQGLRLVAVSGSRVTFMGKRKIEVKW